MEENKTRIFHEDEINLIDGIILTIFDGQERPYVIDLNDFEKDKITFGTSENNDIVLKSGIISHNHGYFSIKQNRCTIFDNNSTNGTYINGEKIMSHQLKVGDIIKVDNLKNPLDKGVTILFGSKKEENWMEYKIDLTTDDDTNLKRKLNLVGNQQITIGRDKDCNIVLDHVSVSKVHAIIEIRDGEFFIRDNNSTNGLSINGKITKEETKLKEKDLITITNSKLVFTKTAIRYYCNVGGVGLDAIDIVKTVKTKSGNKNISNHISLSIEPGEFIAIIGGSGAGKTTFMNAISGYNKATSGQVVINGEDLYSNYETLKSIIGYVPQQDIVYDNLKLYDMLYYTAKLRMPADTTEDERQKRIAEVIEMVELKGKEDTFINRLSGGQKKRASIAVELLSDPNLFFLDEPCSGLDPGTENNLMQTMRNLSRRGKTIILVTHSTLNLELVDKIIFLGAGGNLCFFGSYKEALDFFKVDNLIPVYNYLNNESTKYRDLYKESKYVTKPQYGKVKKTKKQGKKRKKSIIKQTGILCKRYLHLLLNDKQRMLLLLLQAPLLALLIAVVADGKQFTQYEMTKSILFALSCSAFWVGILNAIQEVCKERVILRREYMTGLRLISYILSKLIVLGVLCIIQSVLLIGVFTFAVGSPDKGLLFPPFVEMLITTFLTAFSATAMGIFVSSIFKNGDRAMTVAPILLMPQILFSGLAFKLSGFSEKISLFVTCRWTMEGYGTTADLNNLELRLQETIPTLTHEWEAFFEHTTEHLLSSWGVLGIFTLVFSVASILILRNLDKN